MADLALPPEKTARGLDEMTLTQFKDGTMLLVMRGSNDKHPEMPAYKWFSLSRDHGFTWTPAQPWGYSDGSLFYSSASMSQILAHSNGKHYWLGNIAKENALGNQPRDVLSIHEIDPKTFGLKKETLFVVDQVKPGEPPETQLSNFYAHEDRVTKEIVVDMPYFTKKDGAWVGDTYQYRVEV